MQVGWRKMVLLPLAPAAMTALIACDACTKQQAIKDVHTIVNVATDVCMESGPAQAPPGEDWVDLICQAVDVAGGFVHVIMPRQAWLKALHPEAGAPGK